MPPKSTYFFPKLLTGSSSTRSTATLSRGAVTRIYTRKGDDGTTSLWYGGRVAKTDARTEAYGSIDEAGAALGVARSLCGPDDAELAADLLRLQRELFVAGAELATAPEAAGRLEDGVSRVTDAMVEALEPIIDRYMDRVDLPPQVRDRRRHHRFRRSSMSRAATIRRAERRVVALKEADGLASEAVLRLPEPRLRPGLRDGALRRRRRAGAVRGPRRGGGRWLGSTARRRQGFTHDVEIQGGHRLVIDEPEEAGGAEPGPLPHPHPRRRACRLHGDHDRDVRGPQGLGRGRGRGRGGDGVRAVQRAAVVRRHPATTDAALTEDQVERLRVIAGKCPVHRALSHEREV